MSGEAGKKLIEGAKEMLAVAKGEQPAARVTIKGHAYVPEATIATLRAERDDYKADYLRRHADVMTMMNRALIAESRAEAAEASLAEVATALPFLDRLARALKNKNGGKYNDAWTDDGYTLSGMVSAFRTALARLDTPEKK